MFVNYLRIDDDLDLNTFNLLRKQLPGELISRNKRFHRFRDQQRNLFGLLLMKWIWAKQCGGGPILKNLKSTQYHRPYLPGSAVDFNISHAGDFVICVVSPEARVGIDIEKKKQVDFSEFENTMNAMQWGQIHASDDPEALFYQFWCIKESVIKADGRGLSIPLDQITLTDNTVSYSHKSWFIRPFKLDHEHFGCLASDQSIAAFNVEEVHWSAVISL